PSEPCCRSIRRGSSRCRRPIWMRSPGEVGRPSPSMERSVAEVGALACLKIWLSTGPRAHRECARKAEWADMAHPASQGLLRSELSLSRKRRHQKENAMSHLQIIRAWKDAAYRLSLSDAERALLPNNPAGLINLTDDDLDSIAGGVPPDTAPIVC